MLFRSRNLGIMGAVELAPRPGAPATRAYDVFVGCFEKGVMVRQSGETLAMSPPLIAQKHHIDELVGTFSDELKRVA